jgi:glycosyltransferase involved in cell wall biosynthesis
MSLGRPHLSVVIPVYNEKNRLPASLEKIDAYLVDQRIDAEILVVDDGSKDGTGALAEEFLARRRGQVIELGENRGKGAAVRRGVIEARGRWVLMTDADLSAPIEEHRKLAETARDTDADIVIGSRGLASSQV